MVVIQAVSYTLNFGRRQTFCLTGSSPEPFAYQLTGLQHNIYIYTHTIYVTSCFVIMIVIQAVVSTSMVLSLVAILIFCA